jgi:hypothetical protein
MGITTSLTMESPIAVRARSSSSVAPELLDGVSNDRSGHIAAQALWEAMVSGNRVAIRAIASAYLASTSTAPAGVGRERFFLAGAAAHADQVEVRCLSDLVVFLDEMLDGLTLMQMATMDFGARRPGVLESPAAAARERIAETRQAVQELVVPGAAQPWLVVRNLSFFGDMFLSAAVSRALLDAGDNGNAEVVRAAHTRHLHGHPEMSLEIVDQILGTSLHPWALNCKVGSLGDLYQFKAAAEVALVSIAICPNRYSGNAGRRAFRNIGRTDLSSLADRIATYDSHPKMPPGFVGTHRQVLSILAADLLHEAGRRDLAELPMQTQRSTEPWARAAREAIDAGKSPRAAVRKVMS